jgi:hypothetical protein
MADPDEGGPAMVVSWSEGETVVRWAYDGLDMAIPLREPPQSVTAWHDPPCVIVVEQLAGTLGLLRKRLLPTAYSSSIDHAAVFTNCRWARAAQHRLG